MYFFRVFFYGRSHKAEKNICVFQVSRPYLGFCPDLKHSIVNCEQNVVKFAGKWGGGGDLGGKCIKKQFL